MSNHEKEIVNNTLRDSEKIIIKESEVPDEKGIDEIKKSIPNEKQKDTINPKTNRIFNQIFIPQFFNALVNFKFETKPKKFDLKEIFLFRNRTFKREFEKIPFMVSTPILYKNQGKYTLYPLIRIYKNTLVILKHSKESKNKNTTNTKTPNSTSNSKEEISKTKEDHSDLIEPYDEYHPILTLNFNVVTANLMVNQKKFKMIIAVLSFENLVFKLKIPNNNKEIFNKLVLAIYNAIYTSKGNKTNLMGVSLRKNFHKDFYMSEKAFANKAKTGDLIIFRSFDCSGKVQRCYTRSEYDHVAVLIRINEVLCVYEATSREGCKERPWRDFLMFMWNLLYDKIVYRELIINVDNEEQKKEIQREVDKKIEDFLYQTKDKKYYLGFKAIICGGKVNEKERERINKWEGRNGFSCSSLVFAAYLNCGILSYDKNVDSVLPGEFCLKEQLKLNKPFSLGKEQIIDFSS